MAIARRFLSTNNSSSAPPSVAKAVSADPPSEVTVESDFVVILAALLCALICVVGLIAVARCAWLRRGGAGENGGRPRGHPAANKGLKKKVLQSLPKFVYGPAFVAENGGKQLAADCAICLAEYVEGDEIRMLPQCGHAFHVHCIDTWLGSHSSCPSCRQILIVARCSKCGGGEFPTIPGAGDNTGTGGNFLV